MFISPAAKFAAGLMRFRPHSNSIKRLFIRPKKLCLTQIACKNGYISI